MKKSNIIILSIVAIIVVALIFVFRTGSGTKECNVQVINLHGDLYPANVDAESLIAPSIDIARQIDDADNDESIKAIVLDIYSQGGMASSGEEIAQALKNAQKPTIAFIRDYGLSAAYLAATGADKIFASKYADVGSIAVTASYLDNVKFNEKEGFNYNQLSTGKYKDTFSSDKQLTEDEKKLIMKNLEIAHDDFVKDVALNRNMDIEKVRELADGSVFPGQIAKEKGLVDEVGTIYDVKNYLHELLNQDIAYCQVAAAE